MAYDAEIDFRFKKQLVGKPAGGLGKQSALSSSAALWQVVIEGKEVLLETLDGEKFYTKDMKQTSKCDEKPDKEFFEHAEGYQLRKNLLIESLCEIRERLRQRIWFFRF